MSEEQNIWARLELSAEINPAELAKKRVLLIGAGGLGNDLALRLAGCHIAHLTLVDGDTVSHSNIPHSTLFLPDHVGLPKVAVIAHFLAAKFPEMSLDVQPHFVQQVDRQLFAQHDLIICAPDNDQTRRWVNFYAVQNKIPALFLGVSGSKSAEWTGYTYLYQPDKNACFACFAAGGEASGDSFEAVPTNEDVEESRHICGGDNVPMPMLAPVVGMMASYAASLALKLLAGLEPIPTYSYLDLKAARMTTLDINSVPECAVCGSAEEFEMSADFLAKLKEQNS